VPEKNYLMIFLLRLKVLKFISSYNKQFLPMKTPKFNSIHIAAALLFISFCNQLNAQCNIVSGPSGTIHDSSSTTLVNYTVAMTTGASMSNLGIFTACNLTFPGIQAPWCGNSNIVDTVTYTFSSAIYSVDVFIAYVGVNGITQPESFTITTNGSTPVVTVDAGTCAPWIISNNQITSPSIPGGLNALATVASSLPFTTMSIISGTNSTMTGGSSYGLCDASALTDVTHLNHINVSIYPNPVSNMLNVILDQNNDVSVKLINMFGQVVAQTSDAVSSVVSMDISELIGGTYIAEVSIGGRKLYKKIIKE
jgi:hypothetical protein